ncbi:MAG: hypothetical protein AB8I80_06790, partial [Anaerolineae bacterium]
MVEPKRRYEKGENRRKHLGPDHIAQIVYEHGGEVGKCPRGLSLETAQKLADGAIEEHKSRQPDVPFRLW